MKKYVLIFLLFALGSVSLYSQGSLSEMKEAIANKDFEKASALVETVIKENPKNLEARVLAGDVYTEYNEYDKALKQYLAAYDIDDDNIEVLRKTAITYAKLDIYDKAEKFAKDAIEEDEKSLESQLVLAEVYIEAGNFSDAELAITKARNLDRKSPRPYEALGDLYFASNVYELAKTNYEEALSIDSTLINARVNLAKSYFWLGNREYDEELRSEYYKRSLNEWGNVTKLAPKDANAYFEQGRILYMAQIFDKAAQALNNYVQLRPSGDIGRWWLAQSLYEIGRCDSAAPHLLIVAENIDTVRNKARLLLARCYGNSDEYAKSAEIYSQLAAEGELDIADRRRYGKATLFAGDTTSALEIYKSAIKDDAGSTESCQLRTILGQIELRRKNYDSAIAFFDELITNPACATSDNSQITYLLAYSYLLAGSKPEAADSLENYKKAVKYFEETLATDSTNYPARLLLGDALINLNKTDDALKNYQQVANISLDSADNIQYKSQALSKISNYYLQNQNWTKLAQVTAEWTAFDKENEWAWLFRAFGAQGTQKLQDACSYYNKVLKINPENSTARKNYNRFCTD